MEREQAVHISDHLLDAYVALDEAGMAIAGLGKEERIALGASLQGVVRDLREKVLRPIYEQYPDLQPPEAPQRPPAVSSELAWSEVRLPPSVTERQLDDVIFSVLAARWQKTAMVVVRAMRRCEELGLPLSDELIAARLRALSDSDRIEGIGDLRMWRHSEVRLKPCE